MASADQPEDAPAQSVTATTSWRSLRFGPADLEEIVSLCGSEVQQRWTCSQVTDGISRGENDLGRFEVERRYQATTVAELAVLAPKGRIFHLEGVLTCDDFEARLVFGEPKKKHRWMDFAVTASGSEVPDAYERVASFLASRSKTGLRWHLTGAFAASLLVMTPGFFLCVAVWMWMSLATGNAPQVRIGVGVSLAFMYWIVFVRGGMGVLEWVAASSVTLTPKFGREGVLRRLRSAAAWVKGLYVPSGNVDYRNYVVTTLALVVATLSWLFPRK